MELDGKEKIITGLVGFMLLLAGFGGNALLTDNEFQNAYICDLTKELGVFAGGISGTAYTGYPHAEDRTEPVRCVNGFGLKGRWVDLESYAESKGVDPLSFLVQQKTIMVSNDLSPSRDGLQYQCSPEGCIKIR